MQKVNSFLFIIALFFTSLGIAKSQSVVESITTFDTLCNITLPNDANKLFTDISDISILFDDPSTPRVDLEVSTDMQIYVKTSETIVEYFIVETYDDGVSVVSDYICVQRNLPFPMYLGNDLTITFYVGWSPLCPEQLNSVGVTDDTFIIRRNSGIMFLKSLDSSRKKISDGRKL